MTWLEFKRTVRETTSRLTSEAVPIVFLHGEAEIRPTDITVGCEITGDDIALIVDLKEGGANKGRSEGMTVEMATPLDAALEGTAVYIASVAKCGTIRMEIAWHLQDCLRHIRRAVDDERKETAARLKAAHDVAADFQRTLAKALDVKCWHEYAAKQEAATKPQKGETTK